MSESGSYGTFDDIRDSEDSAPKRRRRWELELLGVCSGAPSVDPSNAPCGGLVVSSIFSFSAFRVLRGSSDLLPIFFVHGVSRWKVVEVSVTRQGPQ